VRRPKHGGIVLAFIMLLAATGCAGHAPQPRVQPEAAAAEEPRVDPAAQTAFDQAVALLRQRQYQQAVSILSPISEAHPELPGPLVNLAVAYIHLNRQEQAVTALQQALASDAEHPAALNWLAILERRAGRFEQARSLYQQLLAAHPESRYGHLNLGILCDLYLQQTDCALTHYRRYQQLAADDDTDVGRWIADLERRQQRNQP
jgi:Flp pilus assembly protein TadD